MFNVSNMLVTHVNNGPKGRNVINNVRNFWPISNGTLMMLLCKMVVKKSDLCYLDSLVVLGALTASIMNGVSIRRREQILECIRFLR